MAKMSTEQLAARMEELLMIAQEGGFTIVVERASAEDVFDYTFVTHAGKKVSNFATGKGPEAFLSNLKETFKAYQMAGVF